MLDLSTIAIYSTIQLLQYIQLFNYCNIFNYSTIASTIQLLQYIVDNGDQPEHIDAKELFDMLQVNLQTRFPIFKKMLKPNMLLAEPQNQRKMGLAIKTFWKKRWKITSARCCSSPTLHDPFHSWLEIGMKGL